MRNNYVKAHLNKFNDFVDHPFFNFLSPVNDTSGSLIGYIYQDPFMKEAWSKYGAVNVNGLNVQIDKLFGKNVFTYDYKR